MSTQTPLPSPLETAGWSLSEDGLAIEKRFKFKNFRDAVSWMMRAAFEAEALDHHPEWSNVYNTVSVRLTSHDAGKLTEKDTKLAERMEAIGESR